MYVCMYIYIYIYILRLSSIQDVKLVVTVCFIGRGESSWTPQGRKPAGSWPWLGLGRIQPCVWVARGQITRGDLKTDQSAPFLETRTFFRSFNDDQIRSSADFGLGLSDLSDLESNILRNFISNSTILGFSEFSDFFHPGRATDPTRSNGPPPQRSGSRSCPRRVWALRLGPWVSVMVRLNQPIKM